MNKKILFILLIPLMFVFFALPSYFTSVALFFNKKPSGMRMVYVSDGPGAVIPEDLQEMFSVNLLSLPKQLILEDGTKIEGVEFREIDAEYASRIVKDFKDTVKNNGFVLLLSSEYNGLNNIAIVSPDVLHQMCQKPEEKCFWEISTDYKNLKVDE